MMGLSIQNRESETITRDTLLYYDFMLEVEFIILYSLIKEKAIIQRKY